MPCVPLEPAFKCHFISTFRRISLRRLLSQKTSRRRQTLADGIWSIAEAVRGSSGPGWHNNVSSCIVYAHCNQSMPSWVDISIFRSTLESRKRSGIAVDPPPAGRTSPRKMLAFTEQNTTLLWCIKGRFFLLHWVGQFFLLCWCHNRQFTTSTLLHHPHHTWVLYRHMHLFILTSILSPIESQSADNLHMHDNCRMYDK